MPDTLFQGTEFPPTKANTTPSQMRMREKIAHFNFELKWVAGKTHYIGDALSQAPVFGQKEQLKETEEEARWLKIADDPVINLIASAAGDIKYQRIILAKLQGYKKRIGSKKRRIKKR